MENFDSDIERTSNVSRQSVMSSQSNVVMMNPDGTLMAGTSAITYSKKKEEEKMVSTAQPGHQVLYIVDDDEVIFYGDTNDIPVYFDDFVRLYLRHKKIFTYAVIIFMLAEIVFGVLGYLNRDATVLELKNLYPQTSLEYLSKALRCTLIIDAIFAGIYYLVGIISLFTRSSRALNVFTTLSLGGLFIQMILAYVNKFNFMIFLMRFVLLIYSRFLNQIMISLVLIPTVTSHPQQYATFMNS